MHTETLSTLLIIFAALLIGYAFVFLVNWLAEWLTTKPSAEPEPATQPKWILQGYTEAQLRHAFLTSPDSDWFKAVLEQCDQNLMNAVQDLVNESEQLSDGQLRQRVGELRGLTELREALENRERQARKDQDAANKVEEEQETA